ncbi:GMP synthetase [Alkalispirochaeta sphaeroplastigenens]|uniref:GMP synthase (glutamine-hydrolyzing) n=1 Tax=Alkalispirochaeta sphaeroplastigenens TaxID=1187066 RepID=A0A2S4K0G7_9SPIO|nr:glutamine-hydrolyzing GMP synthase [Alkalispirochaeta sphaeroplastigenens]POR05246.1 GMP synthetase [Alkalispirochaeta sphaeroplastigenens]
MTTGSALTPPSGTDRIVILDFGSQTTHLIGRRIREQGIFAEIVAGTAPMEDWIDEGVRGVILSGSPSSIHDEDAPLPDRRIYSRGIPLLGICYGLHVTAHLLGGEISRAETREYGPAPVEVVTNHEITSGVSRRFTSWMSHGDAIRRLPPGAREIATTSHGVTAIVTIPEASFVGLQFHPEVTHSEQGLQILDNFAAGVCQARRQWSVENYLEQLQGELRGQAGDKPILLLISGGVDSSVVAALLLQTFPPEQIHLMYIDTGLMRKDESVEIGAALRKLGARNLYLIDAEERFLSALAGAVDPEKKRHIIGDLFISVQEDEIASRLSGDYLLAQGTLYTDLIESGHGSGGTAKSIKSHHNVASPLVRKKREAGLILEPLAALYKDEVRDLGRLLGLPEEIVGRHPFPGPGLGVRVLGEVTRERCDILREADAIFIRELRKAGLYDAIWQAFAVLLPIQSVGVAGDSRAYGNVVALRAVTSTDGMTADVYGFEPAFLRTVSAAITNGIPQVGRVVYDCSGKPPATIEWE